MLADPGPREEAEAAPAFEACYFREVYRSDYDRRNPRYKHRSYVSEVRALATGGSLLDVGCALGAFLREAREAFDCAGIDVSEHAISVARQRLQGLDLTASGLLEYAPGTRYDVVTCFDVLEHIPDLPAALRRLGELLAPGGLLMISVPVYDTFVGWLVGRVDRDPTHVHCTSRYAWLARLDEAGFEVVDWKGIVRAYARGLPYLHFCSRRVRRFSPAILVAARVRNAR